MGYIYETIDLKDGHKLEVIVDEHPDSPRTWDNLGTMICFHRRYILGDDHSYGNSADSVDEFLADIAGIENYLDLPQNDRGQGITDYLLKKAEEKNFILPLYLYDHSGITMNTTGFSCKWDSGQVGFIYVSYEKVRKEYNWKRLTKKCKEKIYSYLTGEVEVYDQYLTGDVYGFCVKDSEDNHVDSCWGFYGSDWETNGMKDHIDSNLLIAA